MIYSEQDIRAVAASLKSDDGENLEYDRALSEMVERLTGDAVDATAPTGVSRVFTDAQLEAIEIANAHLTNAGLPPVDGKGSYHAVFGHLGMTPDQLGNHFLDQSETYFVVGYEVDPFGRPVFLTTKEFRSLSVAKAYAENCAKAWKPFVVANVSDRLDGAERGVFANMDWKMLRAQKSTLVELAWDDRTTVDEAEHIDGIVNFLDHFQDYAVRVGAVTESEVFGDLT